MDTLPNWVQYLSDSKAIDNWLQMLLEVLRWLA